MKAIQVTKHGVPEALRLTELPDPQPGPGQVVVRVAAACINFADLLMRLGLYPGTPKPPFTPGFEVAGAGGSVGERGLGPSTGDRVPALPVNYLTAYQALTYMAHLRAGERVLIHAAAGGVGLAAIQLAKLAGAEIFGTASASKHEVLPDPGPDHAIDYRTQGFSQEVRLLPNNEEL